MLATKGCNPTAGLAEVESLMSAGAKRGGQDNSMRNVIFAINITLDGCCDHTKQVANDEILEYYTQLLRDADLFVYGRKTYQLMVP